MKMMYCWRCDSEMPMLDEEEWEQLSAVLAECTREVKNTRKDQSIPLGKVT
jgi:hypothetical protein